jgi:hypothetical protein
MRTASSEGESQLLAGEVPALGGLTASLILSVVSGAEL